ncbi:hypothetical protein [Nocardioides bruguierae]|uniref:Uncharacterized protein n=1 Tax=Nocardioides bruguierae TaxID=2945102 RepID=A0A9X2IFN5_9ACTN|nr:hypothetical protein [Nocardioides bruguierae]MCM0621248.1 hypothetical protein [Nocardioides bruguierae]
MSTSDDDRSSGPAQGPEGTGRDSATAIAEGWDGRAMSTRGYVIMALIPFIGAALLFGLVALNAQRTGTGEGTAVRLPTNSWLPGQAVGASPVAGELVAGEGGCVYLDATDGTRVWPVWPAGWTAQESESGVISLYDDSSSLVARTGTSVTASGETTTDTDYTGTAACAAGADSVQLIESEVVPVG